MALKRLITVLTINEGVLFRTRNFIPDYRYTPNFADAWSIDEVVLLDISRDRKNNRDDFYNLVQAFAMNCFVPLAVGGGVETLEEVGKLLRIGADKVVINTKGIEEPGFITEVSKNYGAQCVVASIDVKKNSNNQYEVYSHNGALKTDLDLIDWAIRLESLGAGEIVVQSIDLDGTLEGYDCGLIGKISDAVNIPVLGCSGAGTWQHFVDVINDGKASAACTTNIYHFTESSIKSAKSFMKKAGLDVRV